jgi:hemerythrin superfamily protein
MATRKTARKSARRNGGTSTRRASSKNRSTQRTKSASASRRGGSAASKSAIQLLKQDHREVEQLLRGFESGRSGRKEDIARQICQALTVHAQIEEEIFYPAAREALRRDDEELVAEATVEHASLKDLISQIEASEQSDEIFEARVKVLGEYVKHHVREEEGEIFPKLQKTSVDLEALGEQLSQRKNQLMGADEGASLSGERSSMSESEEGDEEELEMTTPRSGDRGSRPSASRH